MSRKNIHTDTKHAKVHSERVQHMLSQLVDHLKYDIQIVDSPRFQALAETTREVLGGLKRAYQHFDEANEKGFGGRGKE
jgi:hypothetical protein